MLKMEAIYIPNLLRMPGKSEEIRVEDYIPGMETLTPVRGTIVVTHRGTYLEVKANAEAIKTLTCDRSLQQYNHRLVVDTTELIWLDVNAGNPYQGPLEREVAVEDLTESLPPNGYFDPEVWLYEQLSLALPLRQVSEQGEQASYDYIELPPQTDSRWSSLAALKEQLSESQS